MRHVRPMGQPRGLDRRQPRAAEYQPYRGRPHTRGDALLHRRPTKVPAGGRRGELCQLDQQRDTHRRLPRPRRDNSRLHRCDRERGLRRP